MNYTLGEEDEILQIWKLRILYFSIPQPLSSFKIIPIAQLPPPSRDAFKQFDKDGNGFIDRDELISLMESLGQKLTEAEIDEMLKDADFDRDGKISYQGIIQ